jgi:hypothetical protein
MIMANQWKKTEFGKPWTHQLSPGDEIRIARDGRRRRKNDIGGQVLIVERMKTKNIAAFDPRNGQKWTVSPWSVEEWRKGDPSNLDKQESALPYVPNPDGVRDLSPGDPILIVVGPTKGYPAFFEHSTASSIHYRQLDGRRFRAPLDSFICRLPRESFPVK